MDTKKDCNLAGCEKLPNQTENRMIVGAKQLRKALLRGLARKVFLAENADPAITEPLAALCEKNHVLCIWVSSMEDLGRACGIDVGTAAAAVVA